MPTFFDAQSELLATGTPFATVTVVDVLGSTPQDRGSKMIVTSDGLHHGTVGGGKVEAKALGEALRLLASNSPNDRTHFAQWNLQTDVGMTCGGVVKLFFETHRAAPWNISIFGAGHVAQALVRTLLPLECHITLFDTRADWISKLPESPKLTATVAKELPAKVDALPDDAYVILMTMGHATDAPILQRILAGRRTFPYLGVIGSAAKRATLRRGLKEASIPGDRQDAFFCPIGLPLGTNHPYEIAVAVAAQLIQVRDTIAATTMPITAAARLPSAGDAQGASARPRRRSADRRVNDLLADPLQPLRKSASKKRPTENP
jgi:xanthine dehydrogenase accessory factor